MANLRHRAGTQLRERGPCSAQCAADMPEVPLDVGEDSFRERLMRLAEERFLRMVQSEQSLVPCSRFPVVRRRHRTDR